MDKNQKNQSVQDKSSQKSNQQASQSVKQESNQKNGMPTRSSIKSTSNGNQQVNNDNHQSDQLTTNASSNNIATAQTAPKRQTQKVSGSVKLENEEEKVSQKSVKIENEDEGGKLHKSGNGAQKQVKSVNNNQSNKKRKFDEISSKQNENQLKIEDSAKIEPSSNPNSKPTTPQKLSQARSNRGSQVAGKVQNSTEIENSGQKIASINKQDEDVNIDQIDLSQKNQKRLKPNPDSQSNRDLSQNNASKQLSQKSAGGRGHSQNKNHKSDQIMSEVDRDANDKTQIREDEYDDFSIQIDTATNDDMHNHQIRDRQSQQQVRFYDQNQMQQQQFLNVEQLYDNNGGGMNSQKSSKSKGLMKNKKDAVNASEVFQIMMQERIEVQNEFPIENQYTSQYILLDDSKAAKDREDPIIYPKPEDMDREIKEASIDPDLKIINANQIVYQRNQPDGESRILWTLFNLGDTLDYGYNLHSPPFTLQDNSCWSLIYTPQLMSSNGEQYSTITLVAEANNIEMLTGVMKRHVSATFSSYTKADGGVQSFKTWQFQQQFDNQTRQFVIQRFYNSKRDNRQKLRLDQMFNIGVLIEPLPYVELEENNVLSQTQSKRKQSLRNRQKHEYNGLINEGTTCYLNSLIQTLFIIKAFRRAVYLMPTNIDDYKSIPFCLQRIFYNLQTGREPVRTFELLNAFGWNAEQMNQQHDVNEFFLVLSDTLEQQMNNTTVSGTYANLFEGISENVIQCLNVDYESSKQDKFNCLQLSMNDSDSIEDSIQNYVKAEELKGDNQYAAEGHGKQDARKYIRFKKLPPVLQVQVNRFAYDMNVDRMAKINTRLRFEETLDLDSVLPQEVQMSQNPYSQYSQTSKTNNLYHLHSILIHRGGIGAGHYFAFIRPSLDDKWFEFNDSKVEVRLKSNSLSTGNGGFESTFEHKNGQIYEKQKINNTSAYMLVYIRDSDRDEIMRDIPVDEIPPHLKERFDQENQLNAKLEKDLTLLEDQGHVMITSFDTIKSWTEGGIQQVSEDIYLKPRFLVNDEQRLCVRMNKKDKINDLMIEIRKNTKYPAYDLNLYRLKYHKQHGYQLILINQETQNQSIFIGNNAKSAIYFICHNKDPMKPILKKFDEEEKVKRHEYYQKLIDFVSRRDLDINYKRHYKKKQREVWQFISQENVYDNNEKPDDYDEESSEYLSAVENHNSNSAIKNLNQNGNGDAIMEDNENTLDIPNNYSDVKIRKNSDEISQINSQQNNQQNAQQFDPKQSRLIILKTFVESQAGNHLQIIGQLLINTNRTLQEILLEAQNEQLINDPYIYDLLLEYLPSHDKQSFIENLDKEQLIYKLDDEELQKYEISALPDGQIFILTPKSQPMQEESVRQFLNWKNNEVYVFLQEKDGNDIVHNYGKRMFSYTWGIEEIYDAIREYIAQDRGIQVEEGFIQVRIKGGDQNLEYGQQETLEFIITEDNVLIFHQNPFHLSELNGKLVSKIHYYKPNNIKGQVYTKLINTQLQVKQVIKQIVEEEGLQQLKDGEILPENFSLSENDNQQQINLLHFVMMQIDKQTQTPIQLVGFDSQINQVNEECKRRQAELRLQAIPYDERFLFKQNNLNDWGFLICQVLDQYSNRVGHPFVQLVQRDLSVDEIQIKIIEKIKTLKIMQKVKQNESRSNESSHNISSPYDEEQDQKLVEIPEPCFEEATIAYLEYFNSRRMVNYSIRSVREISERERDCELVYPKGSNCLHLAIEVSLSYDDDNIHRGGGGGHGGQLKINAQPMPQITINNMNGSAHNSNNTN
eukprot:403369461